AWGRQRVELADAETVWGPRARRWTPSDARHACGAAYPGSNTVALGCGVIVTVVAVSTHWAGMVAGSCAYCVQSGVGTAPPTHTSWASAFDRPGAARAAE